MTEPTTDSNGSELLLVDKGKTDYAIVIPTQPSPTEKLAAQELQRHLLAMSGVFCLITTPVKRFILIARSQSLPTLIRGVEVTGLYPDGYVIFERDGNLYLVGADDRGLLYLSLIHI